MLSRPTCEMHTVGAMHKREPSAYCKGSVLRGSRSLTPSHLFSSLELDSDVCMLNGDLLKWIARFNF